MATLKLALRTLVKSPFVTAVAVLSLALGVALLVAVAFSAGYLPARRASRVDPMVALRSE